MCIEGDLGAQQRDLVFKYGCRSTSLGEKHDSESGADSSGWQIGGKSGDDCAGVSVTSADSAPDGLYQL